MNKEVKDNIGLKTAYFLDLLKNCLEAANQVSHQASLYVTNHQEHDFPGECDALSKISYLTEIAVDLFRDSIVHPSYFSYQGKTVNSIGKIAPVRRNIMEAISRVSHIIKYNEQSRYPMPSADVKRMKRAYRYLVKAQYALKDVSPKKDEYMP